LELRVQVFATRDPAFYRAFGDLLHPAFFSNPIAALFMRIVHTFTTMCGAPPDYASVVDMIQRWKGLDDPTRKSLLAHAQVVYTSPLQGGEYVRQLVMEEVRRKALKAAAYQVVKLQEKAASTGTDVLDRVQEVMATAIGLGSRTGERGVSLRQDYGQVFDFLEDAAQEAIPTGMAELDFRLKGGLRRGELGLIVAPPKRGKTTFLVNLAFGAMLAGYKVLYFTYEDGEQAILTRLCSRI